MKTLIFLESIEIFFSIFITCFVSGALFYILYIVIISLI